MKRLLLLLFIGLTTITMQGQISNGYYRMKNTSKYGRYLTISNNKVDETNKNEIMNGREGNVFGLKTVKDVVSDPSSIIYISKDETGKSQWACNIQAQGINPLKFLKDNGAELRAYPSGRNFFIYGNKGDIVIYLVDNPGSDGFIKAARKNAYPDNQEWEILPINNTTEYLGIAPNENIKVGDKYYTTIYAGFPFQLSEGMKAYYIDSSDLGAATPTAQLKEISGKVPAATPVIIECSSLNPADNKVTPLAESEGPAAVSGNKLVGVYFCYAKMKGNTNQENTATNYLDIRNVTKYDENTMRVLGLVDGKLGLVKATDADLTVTDQGKYIPANKAYFPISASEASAISSTSGILLSTATGIQSIETTNGSSDIYNLMGQKVLRKEMSVDQLPQGVYIINGKKIIKR